MSDPGLNAQDLYDQAADDERRDRAAARRAGFDDVDSWLESLEEPNGDAAIDRALRRAGYLGGEK